MPGHYSTPCGRRPCAGEGAPSDASARLFVCVRCRAQVLICSCCDRGQIYCAGSCAREARYQAQRAAGRRYQASRRGRVCHAARASRYRARQKNVTHQGSPPSRRDDDVAADATATESRSVAAAAHELAVRSDHGPEARALPLVRMSLSALRPRRLPAPSPARLALRPDLEESMTIPPELEAQILRYYHVEKWRVGTIARQLHVHHGTVARVLAQAGLPRIGPPAASLADRAVPAVHPRDAGEVPDADRQPAVRHGARARLPRRPRSLPPPRCPSSAAPGRPRPICACAPCRASRRRSTGRTSAISRSAAPAVR